MSGTHTRGWSILRIQVTVNGTAHESEVEDRTLLVHYIRDGLGLTGTNIGCDTSSCGACTLHVDGESVKSCTMLAAQADGTEITTIEGLATDGELHPMQKAFQENHGLQCGYCTPGHGDGLGQPPRGEPEPDRGRRCASASRATSAAAPATTTSCSRCWPRAKGA